MRRLLLAGLALLLCLVLAGCGVPQKKSTAIFPADEIRADTDEAIDAELADRFARTKKTVQKMFSEEEGARVFSHKFGKTVLPEKPQRIAVIGLEDTAVSMHMPIIGAHIAKSSYLYPELKALGIENIGINTETKTVNLEQVQSLAPDLILLRNSYDESTYRALSKIAPVVPLDLQKEEVAVLAAGYATGMGKEGEARLWEYYGRVKEARKILKERIGNDTVALLRVLKKDIRLYPYSANNTNRFLYELLNLRPDPMQVALDTDPFNMALSMEKLPDLRADYLILSSGYGANSTNKASAAQKRYEELMGDPLWHTLPAVEAGHVLQVDSVIWNAHGLIAKELAIKDLVDHLDVPSGVQE